MPLIRTATATLSGINVNVPNAAETIILSSDVLQLPAGTLTVAVMCWCQLTTAAAITGYTPRVRRGTLVTDPLVGEANAQGIKVAAGSTEDVTMLMQDLLVGGATQQWSLSLQTVGGAAACTAIQAAIAVLVIR